MATEVDPKEDARNMLWLVAFWYFLPAFIIVVMILSKAGVVWDALTMSIVGLSICGAGFAGLAGAYCKQGKKVGRTLGLVSSSLIVINIPIGTFLGIASIAKLNKQEFVNSLH